MFTKLYLDTTDPKMKLYDFLDMKILLPMIVSILFHTMVYVLFCNMVSYIFFNKFLSNEINMRFIGCLIPFMCVGFIGRYYHVKDVYNAYQDPIKTRNHLDKFFITWIFLS